MHNGGKIVIGLIGFLVLITFPIWYNVANDRAGYSPEIEKAVRGENCVRDSAWMRPFHMDLLNEWRDRVVRQGERFEVGADGVTYERSLSATCLSCHENKDKFCDRCHDYLGVDPYCWDCHVAPKELGR
ncbi:MAG: sulfate reduction electron transfer complex DsrMKJOP subunit DsrJ [Candidatus Zixiibacteriota bacterium]